MIENLLIGLMGGALALICTWWTAQTLPAFLPITTLPLALDGKVDGTVLLAMIAVSILTAVLSGIVPAVRASHLSPVAVLKDEALSTSGGLHKSRLAGGLVVTQIALSLLLLSCAGLFIRSLEKAQQADPGFDPSHVFLAMYDMSPLGLKGDARTAFHRHLLERLKELPGVQSATLADFSPLSWTIHSGGAVPEGYVPRPHESISVDAGDVTPGYLETLRTPLLAGRGFTAQDDLNHPLVVLVNKAYVDRYWPGQDALGKRINWGNNWYTVVGVTGNGKYRRLVYDAAPLVLFPMFQRVDDLVTIHVRTAGDPRSAASAVEQTVHGLNAELPLFNEGTLEQSIQAGSVFERLAVALAGSFGLLAMVLAAIGVYGVIAYVTKQRTHEIGIRMALGAGKADIFRQVIGQGLRLTLVGLAVGLAVSLVLTRFLRGMLFGVGTADWLTFSTVAVVLCVVALAACFLPARRAASVDPMQALRTE
jgi:predicted permease